MIYYRVKDWSEHYENNRTRDMVKMAWVPVPNKHDGEGYKRVMREPDGITIYGCWHLILQVASKCLRDRGTLLRDDGTAIDAEALALKTGWNTPADFERTLSFLSSTQVGWLERVATSGEQIPQEGAAIPQEGARKGRELKGIEGKERKVIAPIVKPTPTASEVIYQHYPKKVGRKAAIKAIEAAIKNGADPQMLNDRTKAYAAAVNLWPVDDRQFVPNPATWYNQGRWDDDPATWIRKATNGNGAQRNGSDKLINTWHAKTPDKSMEGAF